jgi:endo-1,4-beta-xylanase
MKPQLSISLLCMAMFFMVACSKKTAPVLAQNQEVKSLYKAYEDFFPIGAAINPELDLKSEKRQKWIASQYNSITPENQMKPKFLRPTEDKWDWAPADEIVEFARKNNLKVRGHALVWYQSTPDWMVKDGEKTASKALLKKRIREHIETTMNRYKNDVYCWDVVNEAISDKPDEIFRANDQLYNILGEDYIAQAFTIARATDHACKLYYNDYRFSDPVKRKKIYELMKRMLAKGVPIDGIGFQTHLVPDEESAEYLQETIDMFSGLGLKIQITELDISVYKFRDPKHPDASKTDFAYTAARKAKQAKEYKMIFDICRKNKDKITGVTFWGTTDAQNNYRTKRIGKMDYPFLFDENMNPKDVFFKVTNF